MSATIQIRVDEELKRKSDKLFKELGTDTSSAIRIFLAQAVASDGFPFEIRKTAGKTPVRALSETEILEQLSIAREHSVQGKQRNAADVITDMRSKYGL